MACIIELRDDVLYVLVGSKHNRKLKIDKAFTIPLSASLFTNHEVNVDDTLIQPIKDAFNQHNVKEKKVNLVINHRVILSKDLLVPKTDRKKLEFIVENEMTALFHLTKEFVVDYRHLDDIIEEGIPKHHVISSAMRRTTIEGLEELFRKLNMRIKSIESSTSTFLRYVENMNLVHPYDPTVIMDASSSYMRYFLYSRGTFKLVRSVNIQIDDRPSDLENSVLHAIELLNQYQSRGSGQSINKIVMVGQEKHFDIIQQATDTGLSITSTIPDISHMLHVEDHDLFDFSNSIGALL